MDGGAGDDVLLGDKGADELSGFAGNDYIFSGPGDDNFLPVTDLWSALLSDLIV